MCRKLTFLISLVLLISWGAVASAADLEIPLPQSYWLPCGVHEYDIDGGTVISNARFNIGDGYGGTLIVQNGGSFTQQCPGDDCDDGLKLPDNSGGTTKLYIYEGTVTCYAIEVRPGRLNVGDGGGVGIGAGAVLRTCDVSDGMSDQYRYDPREWIDNGWLFPLPPCTEEDIEITVDGDCIIVTGCSACGDKA
ncbi:MAG: hypothetical protein ACYSUC_10170, partial [Planctomycetota bacterium]